MMIFEFTTSTSGGDAEGTVTPFLTGDAEGTVTPFLMFGDDVPVADFAGDAEGTVTPF